MKYEAVTPDNTVRDIVQVKVRATRKITPEEMAVMIKFKPDYEPESQMYRLELIDKDLVNFQVQIDALNVKKADLQTIRDKVLIEAEKVQLKD